MSVVAEAERVGEGSERTDKRRFSGVLLALVAVFGIVLGGVAGWVLHGSGGGEDLIVIGGEVTERQEQMLRVGDQFHASFIEGDGDAVAALFVPGGYMTDVGHGETQLRVDDDSLARMINAGPSPSYQVNEPIVVHGDMVVYNGSWAGDWIHVLTFTPSGERIIRAEAFIR